MNDSISNCSTAVTEVQAPCRLANNHHNITSFCSVTHRKVFMHDVTHNVWLYPGQKVSLSRQKLSSNLTQQQLKHRQTSQPRHDTCHEDHSGITLLLYRWSSAENHNIPKTRDKKDTFEDLQVLNQMLSRTLRLLNSLMRP